MNENIRLNQSPPVVLFCYTLLINQNYFFPLMVITSLLLSYVLSLHYYLYSLNIRTILLINLSI